MRNDISSLLSTFARYLPEVPLKTRKTRKIQLPAFPDVIVWPQWFPVHTQPWPASVGNVGCFVHNHQCSWQRLRVSSPAP